MGLSDKASGYTPKENQEFGNRKKLVGDAVCEAKLEKIIGKKDGKEWIILKTEAINCIPDPKGRETTLEPGDEISKLYDAKDDEAIEELMNDLFTAGITYEAQPTDEMQFTAMKNAVDGKLVYMRTWAKDKPKDKLVEGKPSYYQNIKVLVASKITDENRTPQVAF